VSKRGEINGWTCDKCGGMTYVIHVDDGVTPFYLACRASGDLDHCDGMGRSLFYPSAAPPPHVLAAVRWEWHTPGPEEKTRLLLEPEVLEHVEKGGLLLRELTDAGRKALAEVKG
jgi:hypothetical protein